MVFLFFFEAEDGIRELGRSRGLRDVYKRQVADWEMHEGIPELLNLPIPALELQIGPAPVSYTHLTLPTIYAV